MSIRDDILRDDENARAMRPTRIHVRQKPGIPQKVVKLERGNAMDPDVVTLECGHRYYFRAKWRYDGKPQRDIGDTVDCEGCGKVER